MPLIEHKFVGDDRPTAACDKCGEPKRKHRSDRELKYHEAVGDPCEKCGLPAAIMHISAKNAKTRRTRDKFRKGREADRRIVGIDGEGFDTPDGRHIYTLLMAVDEHGRVVAQAENLNGLSTRECITMLLKIPRNTLKFVFMGSYDWTKIIEDLAEADRYMIMHPETRRKRYCPSCKKITPKYECCGKNTSTITLKHRVTDDMYGDPVNTSFDWFNGSFTVAGNTSRRSCKVWDCFKFFQSSFVKAIEAWDIGTPEQRERIAKMKEKRGSFDEEKPEDVRQYCQEECHLLAVMMRKVLNACKLAGIDIRRFDGAGAIASALLKHYKVKDYLGPKLEELPSALEEAVMSAYFGGRFENSCVGAVLDCVYNHDINSAYPYALSDLPCLACGGWKRVETISSGLSPDDALRVFRQNTLGLVHFRVKERSQVERDNIPWAPLPFRDNEGSICYPTGFEGWAWLPEIESAIRGWPDLIEVLDGYVYKTSCDHKPFAWLPVIYRKRYEWGKDAAGIILKLGMNACAGKTMQSVGDAPPFKSWIWGGMLTAITRAQLNDAICCAKDRWNVIAVATDGLFTTEKTELPKPRDTGTFDLFDEKGQTKALGAWGCKPHEQGVFFVKPGMYWDDSKKLMRARGIGRKELNKNVMRIVNAFKKWDRKGSRKVRVRSRRFFGARSSILAFSNCIECRTGWPGIPAVGCPKCKKVGDKFRTTAVKIKDTNQKAYGQWAPRPIEIEFAYLPKREHVFPGGTFGRMRIRNLGGGRSAPYIPGKTSPEGLASRLAQMEALEEPDWSDGEFGDV